MLAGTAPRTTSMGVGCMAPLTGRSLPDSPAGFITNPSNGLWLPPKSVAERDVSDKAVANLQKRRRELAKYDGPEAAQRISDLIPLLEGTEVIETGCMTGLGLNQSKAELLAKFIAECGRPLGGFCLDDDTDLSLFRACESLDCHNPRHFDLSFGRPTLQERKIYIDGDYFELGPNGKVGTIWGEQGLPSVTRSLELFIEFQRRNYPYVPRSKAPLSPGTSSQVRFHPYTGCWEAWSYYCRSADDGRNWQYDGYGRLYQRFRQKKVNIKTGEVRVVYPGKHKLAHRVIWSITPGHKLQSGRVLNHLCGYRRCCNPWHLEQVDSRTNNVHGVRTQSAIKEFEEGREGPGHIIGVVELARLGHAVRELYDDICKSKGL